MMQQSMLLVFISGILGMQSQAQVSSSLGGPNCICTPFFRCFDEETSSDVLGVVDDRLHISARQESQCEMLDVCCINLVQPPGTTPTPIQTRRPNPAITTFRPLNVPAPVPSVESKPQSHDTSHLGDNAFLDILSGSQPSSNAVRPVLGPNPINAACGVRNVGGAGNFTIDGFTDGQAQYGEFPWSVALLTKNIGFGSDTGATNLFVGGGSLIHPSVVLTAAHKPYDNGENLTVRIGEWNFRAANEPTNHQDISVSRIIYHNRFNRKTGAYNIALLILERPAELGETVRTICLPSNPGQNFDGQQCIVSGWGKDIFGEEGRYQRILKSVSVNMVGRSQCQSALQGTRLGTNFNLHLSLICAGDQGQDACTGDGGSPLVCPDPTTPGQYVQVGISSWGIGCGMSGIPGVYVDVVTAVEWIQDQLRTIPNSDVRG